MRPINRPTNDRMQEYYWLCYPKPLIAQPEIWADKFCPKAVMELLRATNLLNHCFVLLLFEIILALTGLCVLCILSRSNSQMEDLVMALSDRLKSFLSGTFY